MEAQVFLKVAPLMLCLKQRAHAEPASELRLKARCAALRMIYSIHSNAIISVIRRLYFIHGLHSGDGRWC